MIDVLLAFWSGFTRPRLIALAGIFLVTFAQAALLTTPFLARVDARYLLAGPNDYGAELTSEVMRIRQSRGDGATMIVHVGSSFSQEAIDEPKSLNRELSARLGRPVRYWPLFMPQSSLWEMGAMMDQVPEGSHGYAVIEVNPGMLANEKDLPDRFVQRAETVLDSPFVENELRKAGRPVPFRTGLAIVDHAGFFSARRDGLWRWALRQPLPGTENFQHRYSTATVREPYDNTVVKDYAARYAERAVVNDAVLEKVVKLAESRGLKVILLVGRLRPGTLTDFPTVERGFAEHMSESMKKLNLPCIDPAAAAGLTADDYLDRYHLWHQPARLKFQAAFVQELGDIIQREEGRHVS